MSPSYLDLINLNWNFILKSLFNFKKPYSAKPNNAAAEAKKDMNKNEGSN